MAAYRAVRILQLLSENTGEDKAMLSDELIRRLAHPDDRTPLAIKNTGADIISYGAPVLPGAMFLVSYLDGVPVCGLPGCVMYAKRTIFDLLLPRLLADAPITAEDIARLGEGGLCLGCAECHWPNCGFGHC